MGSLEHLAEEALRRVGITRGAQHEVQRRPRRVDSAAEIVPLLLNLDIGFIHAVRIVGRPQRWPTPPVQLWRIPLDPAEHRRMIDLETALPQEFFYVTIAQGISEIPSHPTENDLGSKVTPFE